MKKKNKLLLAVTTVKIYEYLTNADTADLAYDEYVNTAYPLAKLLDKSSSIEINDFFLNKQTSGIKIEKI